MKRIADVPNNVVREPPTSMGGHTIFYKRNYVAHNYAARWFSEFRRQAIIISFGQSHNYQRHNYEGDQSNDHNSAVRSSTELILGMAYTSRPARNSWDRSRGRSSSVDRRNQ